MTVYRYEGGTPHLDDPRQLEPDAGSAEGHPIQAPKIKTKQGQLSGVLVTVGAVLELNPLEFRGKIVRLQVEQTAGSAANYTVALFTQDPAATTFHDFDTAYPATSFAVASDPVDVPVDKVYENQDAPTMKRSLYVQIIPDDSATPNDYDIRVTVEQRV